MCFIYKDIVNKRMTFLTIYIKNKFLYNYRTTFTYPSTCAKAKKYIQALFHTIPLVHTYTHVCACSLKCSAVLVCSARCMHARIHYAYTHAHTQITPHNNRRAVHCCAHTSCPGCH